MTLVQASIANNGNSVILIADRLLTSRIGEDVPSYEFEWNKPKILSKGKIGIGFAGAALHADMVEKEIANISDLDKIVEKISEFIKNEKEKIIEQFIKRHTGVSSKDFFNNPQLPIPEGVRGMIYAFLSEFDFQFQCIVCGFDKDKDVRLIAIDAEGNIFELTGFGVVSIGTGQPFSKIYFDLYDYRIDASESDGLFFAYKAKKWSEAPTGVGPKTDILIIRGKEKPLMIADEDTIMKEIDDIYKKEIESRDKIRATLITELDKKINAVKK